MYGFASPAGGGCMRRGTLILLVWLLIGAAAAGQRGFFNITKFGCSNVATMVATFVVGPFNYIGVDPVINCGAPKPAS
jgi:hypothetical protein